MVRRAAAGAAATNSLTTDPASWITRVPPINRPATVRTYVAIEGKTAVAAGQHPFVILFGIDQDGFTDQADRGHFRTISDAISLAAVFFEKQLAFFTADHFGCPPCALLVLSPLQLHCRLPVFTAFAASVLYTATQRAGKMPRNVLVLLALFLWVDWHDT